MIPPTQDKPGKAEKEQRRMLLKKLNSIVLGMPIQKSFLVSGTY